MERGREKINRGIWENKVRWKEGEKLIRGIGKNKVRWKEGVKQ